MNIQPLKSEGVSAPSKPTARPAKPAVEAAPGETPQTARHEKLREALSREPEVRADEVERGKALAADPGYPSDEVLAKLAEIFVNDARGSK